MSPPDDGPMVPLTLKLPAATVDALEQFSEGSTRSATARTFLEFGLQQLTQPGASEALEAHQLLGEFRRLVERWPGGCTPSGAIWCAVPDHLPDPATIAGLAVVATGSGVILAALNGITTIDLEDETITVSSDAGPYWESPLDLPGLAALAPAVAVALHRLGAGPGAAHLPMGLRLTRLESGLLELQIQGLVLTLDTLTAYRWSAELSGLLAGQLEPRLQRREQLEAVLQAPTAEVER